jgi:16S rRNA processing protein RimM
VALSSRPERYQDLRDVFLFGEGRRYTVESAWFHQRTLIFKFAGVDTISDAEALSGSEVRIPIAERMPLEEGEYFDSDLVGSDVIERGSGASLGRVARLEDAGGSGLLVLEDGLMIPFAHSICVEIDPAAKRIMVELPEGLKDLNRP